MKVLDILRDFLYQKFHVLPMFHLKKGRILIFLATELICAHWNYIDGPHDLRKNENVHLSKAQLVRNI